jgi:hypothetical protein
MPTDPVTADRRRLQKLIATAQALRARQDQRYMFYEITRLLNVKGLCHTPELALRFTAYLADLTVARTGTQASPNLALIIQAAETLHRQARRPTSQRRQRLQTLFTQAEAVQNDYQRIYGKPVRLIHDKPLLLIEYALRCALEPALAAEWAYYAARCHCERYAPAHGTGLIPASLEPLEEVIHFWAQALETPAPPVFRRPRSK